MKNVCDWKLETEAHRPLKSAALTATREAGWNAESEGRGNSPSGEPCIADVLAEERKRKLAIEIEWRETHGRADSHPGIGCWRKEGKNTDHREPIEDPIPVATAARHPFRVRTHP